MRRPCPDVVTIRKVYYHQYDIGVLRVIYVLSIL